MSTMLRREEITSHVFAACVGAALASAIVVAYGATWIPRCVKEEELAVFDFATEKARSLIKGRGASKGTESDAQPPPSILCDVFAKALDNELPSCLPQEPSSPYKVLEFIASLGKKTSTGEFAKPNDKKANLSLFCSAT